MSDFYYATKREAEPFREEICDIIGNVYDYVSRNYFNFDYDFSGATSVNMVSYDNNGDRRFLFDMDIEVDDPDEEYTPSDIIRIFEDALIKSMSMSVCRRTVSLDMLECRRTVGFNMFGSPEGIRLVFFGGKFVCHLYFVFTCSKGRQQYIKCDDTQRNYEWVYRDNKYNNISKEIKWLKDKDNALWNDFRNYYLYKMNDNYINDIEHIGGFISIRNIEYITPKTLFMEAVHEFALENGINKKENNSKKQNPQHEFKYVTRKEARPARTKLEKLICQLHNDKDLKKYFTFEHKYVGSSKRNMITKDIKGNNGYDFDVDIIPNISQEQYTPKEIKKLVIKALDKYTKEYGFSYSKDSKSVITIKSIDHKNSEVIYSCDFAIVRIDNTGKKQFIMHDKTSGKYEWKYRGGGYNGISEKYDWIKERKLIQELRDFYLELKNKNLCEDKRSRSIFVESVNVICNRNGYKNSNKYRR